jgi:CBS domain-containing protein
MCYGVFLAACKRSSHEKRQGRNLARDHAAVGAKTGTGPSGSQQALEEGLAMFARDIMTRDIVTVSPTTTVKNLALLLIKNQISGAPVARKDGKIVGVVSQADIVAKTGKVVKSIMSKKVIHVAEDTTVEAIAQLMTTHVVTRLPVMNKNKLVGIVSRADIVGAIARGEHVAVRTPIYDL